MHSTDTEWIQWKLPFVQAMHAVISLFLTDFVFRKSLSEKSEHQTKIKIQNILSVFMHR